MLCVKCNGRLAELRAGTVTIDRCGDCSGIWFDAKELEAVIQHVRAADFEPTALGGLAGEETTIDDHDREMGFCPRCRVTLDRTETLSVAGLHYDRCPQCGGAWLDAGELRKVASDDDASAEMAFFTKRR